MGASSGDSVDTTTDPTLAGYSNLVQQNPGGAPSDAYLNSILNPGSSVGYIDPYSGQPLGIDPTTGLPTGVSPYNGNNNSGLSLQKILGGLGGLATALGPALGAAGKLAANALNQRPQYRPFLPYINAPGAHTNAGVTQPLNFAGQVVSNDPLANYVKLVQGLR